MRLLHLASQESNVADGGALVPSFPGEADWAGIESRFVEMGLGGWQMLQANFEAASGDGDLRIDGFEETGFHLGGCPLPPFRGVCGVLWNACGGAGSLHQGRLAAGLLCGLQAAERASDVRSGEEYSL